MQGLEGTSLHQYTIEQRLGRGGMSEVYLAYDEELRRRVALKVVSGSQTTYLERFRREVEAVRQLNHDHILPALDFGTQEPWHYLVMPYIAGGTLRDLLEEGPLSLEHAGELLQQIAGALQFAHDQGIIHRDMKPSNILLRDEHYAYLADFGLAKALVGANELTQTGSLLGTPEYMAPDLSEGPATTRTDIYSLGIVLYQMVSGHLPFTGDSPVAVYWKHIREQPLPPSYFRPTIPRVIDDIVLHALEKDQRQRFQTARALSDAYSYALLTAKSLEVEDVAEAAAIAAGASEAHAEEQPPGGRVADQPLVALYETAAARPRRFRSKHAAPLPNQVILPLETPDLTSSPIEQREAGVEKNTDAVLPPLPMRAPSRPTPEPVIAATPHYRASPRRMKRSRNLVVSIIALGLLLFIGLPMAYVYYLYTSALHPVNAVGSANGAASLQAASGAASATAQSQTARATAATQATATAAVGLQAMQGTPILVDPLTTNTAGRWAEDGTNCFFSAGSYHVVVTQSDSLQRCALQGAPISDAAMQVDMTLLAGSSAGMLLRASGQLYYDFGVTARGQFFLSKHSGSTSTMLIAPTGRSAIRTTGEKNTLLAVTGGNDFKLYVNGVFVGEAVDGSYAGGQLELVASTNATDYGAQASFSNLKIFNLV